MRIHCALLTSTAPALGRCAPAFPYSTTTGGVAVGAAHEHDSVIVDWLPLVAVGPEGEALLAIGVVHHDRLATVDVFEDLHPQMVTHTCGYVADVYASTDLHQPAG